MVISIVYCYFYYELQIIHIIFTMAIKPKISRQLRPPQRHHQKDFHFFAVAPQAAAAPPAPNH